MYGKKRGDKEKLIAKWEKLSDKERSDIIAYIPKYILSQPDNKFRKDPQTFLNNKSWNDELIGSVTIPTSSVVSTKNNDFEAYKKRQQELGKSLI